ncbi:hypothetical protein [Fimbriiglobus ruber]|uniref:hypothetical protein n=1 Tax=Fimbriiglobus ruber TaxID=1908690 RepID=UPI00117A7CA0|nr:hypothetical protein [Fimbriiglobus ruber]
MYPTLVHFLGDISRGAYPAARALVKMGKNVLVCAGPLENLVCLEMATGVTSWQIERVWEFEREYIGPSAYVYNFVRNPRNPAGDLKPLPITDDSKLPQSNAIVGGPIFIPTTSKDEGSIFVAVAKGSTRYPGQLSECVVYEIGTDGNPISTVTLPRMVRADEYRIHKGNLVWACRDCSFVSLAPSNRVVREFSRRPNLLCTVEWFRQPPDFSKDVWLTSEQKDDSIAFADTKVFRARAGGYVEGPKDHVYRFPIVSVELGSGLTREMELRVPFNGTLSPPKSNYSHRFEPERWHTYSPHILYISDLHFVNDRLRVTLGMKDWSKTLEFDTSKG